MRVIARTRARVSSSVSRFSSAALAPSDEKMTSETADVRAENLLSDDVLTSLLSMGDEPDDSDDDFDEGSDDEDEPIVRADEHTVMSSLMAHREKGDEALKDLTYQQASALLASLGPQVDEDMSEMMQKQRSSRLMAEPPNRFPKRPLYPVQHFTRIPQPDRAMPDALRRAVDALLQQRQFPSAWLASGVTHDWKNYGEMLHHQGPQLDLNGDIDTYREPHALWFAANELPLSFSVVRRILAEILHRVLPL
ncbi:MAG: hypothetical protein MHM6MM_008623, partial [Cercozoa sp. M6MM]